MSWFKAKYNAEPGYDTLLEQLAHTQGARQQLLRPFFEPTEEEREQGIKLPSPAHRAIAELVRSGTVRVLVTTNFDRLLELALEDVGVRPTVIWNDHTLAGAPPIAHSPCTIIKVHGDYLDTRIKNSPVELAAYEPGIDRLLDRVFEDYGLLVCGWSAEYDTALRSAISRAQAGRFPLYWASVGQLSATATELIEKRYGVIVPIQGAETFFPELMGKVRALDDLANHQPLTTKAAVASAKRLMADEKHAIQLHDLIVQEAERSLEQLKDGGVLFGDGPWSDNEFQRRLGVFTHALNTSVALFCAAAYWNDKNKGFLIAAGKMAAISHEITAGQTVYLELKRYPITAVLFGSGVASFLSGNYNLFYDIWEVAIKSIPRHKRIFTEAPSARWPFEALAECRGIPWLGAQHRPAQSATLYYAIKDNLSEYASNEESIISALDKLEYFLTLLHADLRVLHQKSTGEQLFNFLPVGHYGIRYMSSYFAEDVAPSLSSSGFKAAVSVRQEIVEFGENWPPLRAGFFGGSFSRLTEAIEYTIAFFKERNLIHILSE